MGDGYEPGAVQAGELKKQRRSDESGVLYYFGSGVARGDWVCGCVPGDGSFGELLEIDPAIGDFGRSDVVAGARESTQSRLERTVKRGEIRAVEKKRQLGCRTPKSCSLRKYSNRFRGKGHAPGCLAFLCV